MKKILFVIIAGFFCYYSISSNDVYALSYFGL